MQTIEAVRMVIEGRVQGIGFRPALACLALQLHLSGWVRNTAQGVEVHIEGESDRVAQFVREAPAHCPPQGVVQRVLHLEVDCEKKSTFQIVNPWDMSPLSTSIPVDLVACTRCLSEVEDRRDRRYGYYLTSCSHCGPRYTILEVMPYERESTSMRLFHQCPACHEEYRSASARRFHAQTNGCQECGPTLTSLNEVVRCLTDGNVLAVKGIGGYQLLVDARNDTAVGLLRARKGRPAKPLAVMVEDIEQAERWCYLQEAERLALLSSAGPIVVARHRCERLAPSISWEMNTLGVMLPTTPLHAWLVANVGPLAITSANTEGDPIPYRNGTAESLRSLAEVIIDHDREICRPIDDSVVRAMNGSVATIRLARGMAPLPLTLLHQNVGIPVLAVGGHQKVAIALSNGNQSVLGPHLGDMESHGTRHRFIEHVHDWLRLYRTEPVVIVHDLHPEFFTTQWAQAFAKSNNIRCIAVQHHHAHVVSGMIGRVDRGKVVLGIAWDGTGYGIDGTIWGGEALIASASDFQRVASLRPFLMPGGEKAVRQPDRIAHALLDQVPFETNIEELRLHLDPRIQYLIRSRINSPTTTSMGRLIDGVAVLILAERSAEEIESLYEGHCAARLESICDRHDQGIYSMPLCPIENNREQTSYEWDWRPMIREILQDRIRGISKGAMAMRFHRTIARAIDDLSSRFVDLDVVISGGVFQNRILVELLAERWSSTERELFLPGKIPCNDGGLAAGQLAIAMAILEREQCV